MKSDIIADCLEFPFMPEDKLVEMLRGHGHEVWDLRKDPASPAKYVVQLNSEGKDFDEIDLLAIASLGIIDLYYSPLKHFVIKKTDWRPYNSVEAKRGTNNV